MKKILVASIAILLVAGGMYAWADSIDVTTVPDRPISTSEDWTDGSETGILGGDALLMMSDDETEGEDVEDEYEDEGDESEDEYGDDEDDDLYEEDEDDDMEE